MTYFVSPFILKRVVASPLIHYKWDDWNTEEVEEPPNKEVLEALREISLRAILAFGSATAEWILARYVGLDDLALPGSFVEASWIAQIDRRYLAREWEDHPDADEAKWRGPIRGPIGTAMTELMYTGQQLESADSPELQVGWMTNLAAYIQLDPQPYLAWRTWVLGKLRMEYPRSVGDLKGPVVPRESCDPDVLFQWDNAEKVINASLLRARASVNPFLKSDEGLKRSAFVSEPYVFDEASDRSDRTDGL